MSSETIKIRLAQLLRKSQKAVALYSQSDATSEKRSSSSQVTIWRIVNQELADALALALKKVSTKFTVRAAYAHRDQLYGEWRRYQSELYVKREQLIQAATDDHFAKAAVLSERLISVKARMQATRAALHELSVALADTAYQNENEQSSLVDYQTGTQGAVRAVGINFNSSEDYSERGSDRANIGFNALKSGSSSLPERADNVLMLNSARRKQESFRK